MGTIEDLKRPVNAIALGIGLLSLVLSVVFYYDSQKSRTPAFLEEARRPKIYDNKLSSATIKVLDKNAVPITDDIYLLTISFWNAGAIPIEPEDVRQPVRINISGAKRVVDYSIVSQTSPDIAQITLTEVAQQSADNSIIPLELSWKHLDPNFGAKVQILYTGPEDAPISLSGNIVGVDAIVDGRSFIKRTRLGGILDLVIPFVMGMVLSMGVVETIVKAARVRTRKNILMALLTVGVVALIGLIIYIFLFRQLTPPV